MKHPTVVPQNGAIAWAEGWDVTACPFKFDPDREHWREEYFEASAQAWKEFNSARS
jgi:hypothetical protein